jgi:hypothetical protein
MKLERIALEEFRRFRAPFVLDTLQPGLNVFVGPNEAGKSTVAAALRGAFLQRFKTSKVEDFAPWNSTGARPTVTVHFRVGTQQYELRKSFLTRARCELLIDGGARRLEGEQAEDALAALLGFEFATKGQSKAEHGGVPGLLWIQQGDGQNLIEAAGHAGTHLRGALSQLSGELVTGDSDCVFERAVADRAALRDARSNRPKGDYKAAEDALAEAVANRAALLAEKARLDADVDKLAALRASHDRSRHEQPWATLETKAADTRAKLDALARDQEAADALRREARQATQTLALLQERVAQDQRDDETLLADERELAEADQAVAQAREALERAEVAVTAQAEATSRAQRLLEAMHAQAERNDLTEQLARADRELARLGAAHVRAQALTARVATLDTQVREQRIDPKRLTTLRERSRQLESLRLRVDAGATRLHFALAAGQAVDLDGEPLRDAGDRLLVRKATITVPGVGRLQIEPGGADLPALHAEIDVLQRDQTRALAELGVADVADAQARAVAADHAQRDADAARKELGIHAPDGLAALLAAIDDVQARIQALMRRRDALPAPSSPAADADQALTLAAAAAAHREAQTAAAHARQAAAQAQRGVDQASGKSQLLRTQLEARKRDRSLDAHRQARAARNTRLVEARAARDDLDHRVATAMAAITAHQPELLKQDLQRFEQSARFARDAHEKTYAEILQLQGRLDQAGSQGVGEQLAQVDADVERLQRRRDEFARRALALDLLVDLLRTQRDAATQRLQAPLARRLNHYLHLLFPNAALRLDDSLMPVGLQRGDTEDVLRSLSFGTQEQLGVLVRLAYADLLQEAGRPTLLILDDALVHADESRRALMKRALFDAGSRHQILIFTCHEGNWQDMAVMPRRLG